MSPDSSVRILFVGDMHLGRLPSRVPDAALDQGGWSRREIGPAGAWRAIVAQALELGVDAVALAGDLVERDNALFEAYGPLADGVRRLVDGGVTVAGVAGNHDTTVLPRLAAEIEGFHLLGPGGTWTALPVTGKSGGRLDLVGWSFPTRHHGASPLLNPPPVPSGITLGLLHADLDAHDSASAPVTSDALRAVGYQGWFLGHVHRPGPVPADGTPFYLGSVTGLKPTETGLHGPVLVDVDRTGRLTARRLPLATLRWEERALDCTDLADPATGLPSHLLGLLRQIHQECVAELDETLALGVRVTLTGAVDNPAAVEKAVRDFPLDEAVTTLGETVFFVQKIATDLNLRADLAALATRADPPGLLARQILALENPGADIPGVPDPAALVEDLVAAAAFEIARIDRENTFAALDDQNEQEGPPSPDELVHMIARSGRLALAGLLAQTEYGEAPHAAE